jgi:hypothetical protein
MEHDTQNTSGMMQGCTSDSAGVVPGVEALEEDVGGEVDARRLELQRDGHPHGRTEHLQPLHSPPPQHHLLATSTVSVRNTVPLVEALQQAATLYYRVKSICSLVDSLYQSLDLIRYSHGPHKQSRTACESCTPTLLSNTQRPTNRGPRTEKSRRGALHPFRV